MTALTVEGISFRSSVEAIDEAVRSYRDLIIIDGVIRRKEVVEFFHPDKVFLALGWLATTYHALRSQGGRNSTVDGISASCVEASGFRYSNNQPFHTRGSARHWADYHKDYEGKEISFFHHLKYGKSKNPNHTLRIGFNPNVEPRKVVIGYVGRHQGTYHR